MVRIVSCLGVAFCAVSTLCRFSHFSLVLVIGKILENSRYLGLLLSICTVCLTVNLDIWCWNSCLIGPFPDYSLLLPSKEHNRK